MITAQGLCATPFTAASSGDGSFEGYVCMYNVPTADYRRLMIAPQAFKAAVAAPDKVRLLWQHNADEPIGNWTKFEERNVGLYGYGKLSLGASKADDAYALVKSGAIDGISAGWRAQKILRPEEGEDRGFTTLEGNLMEGSLVTFPAFEDARVMKAALDPEGKEVDAATLSYVEMAFSSYSCLTRASAHGGVLDIRKFEQSLRDAGFVSKTEASRIGALVKLDTRWSQLLEARRDDEAEALARQEQAAREAQSATITKIINNLKGVQ